MIKYLISTDLPGTQGVDKTSSDQEEAMSGTSYRFKKGGTAIPQ